MTDATPVPPVAPRRPTVLRAHGDERVDDWYWLRERDDPEVIAYLETENAYTRAMMADTVSMQEALYAEIVARIQETDLSVPVRKGPWRYYSRTVEGRQYAIHCRRPAEPAEPAEPAPTSPGDTTTDADEQVLLDENDLAAGHEYFSLGGLAVSPDHRLMAYAIDTTGGERHRMLVRDLASAEDLSDQVEDVYYGLAWANDGATVFYTRPDDAMRPHQLWRHTVGTGPDADVCVHQEDDERFYVGVSKTKDDAFVVLELESKVTSEARVLSGDHPDGELRVVEPRRQGVEYAVEHHDGRFLIVTNADAENFRLVEAPVERPGREAWRDVVAHRPDVRLEDVDVFAEHLVLYERSEATRRIRVMGVRDGGSHTVAQQESVSSAWGGANPEFGSQVLRYEYSSLVTPRSVYDYDMERRTARLLKRQPVLGGYDPARYRTERAWATADDGTRVPMSLVYREDRVRDGGAPALLYGYGAYEHSLDPFFSSLRLSMLDRGFVYAIAHVRGGGELGRRWYEDGKLLHKTNTFTDFVACARHLVAERWTSADRLVARGGSAGGMLMGAVANLAPELFRAVVAEVPFVDCLTTILDDSLPLTVLEWEEWGNPRDDVDAYAYLKSYSPYDNVTSGPHPDMLVTAGLTDPRVSYWEPAKWVAKLRATDADARVLLKTEMGAGHQGPSGRYDAWRDEALVLAFVLRSVGISA
ncbi:MAG: S9 family peptidase [Actinobacteria bacterium]|nr:MAG: S9 family peptidase [Actinomycetota bacterium]